MAITMHTVLAGLLFYIIGTVYNVHGLRYLMHVRLQGLWAAMLLLLLLSNAALGS